jgi:hypothetical protein
LKRQQLWNRLQLLRSKVVNGVNVWKLKIMIIIKTYVIKRPISSTEIIRAVFPLENLLWEHNRSVAKNLLLPPYLPNFHRNSNLFHDKSISENITNYYYLLWENFLNRWWTDFYLFLQKTTSIYIKIRRIRLFLTQK